MLVLPTIPSMTASSRTTIPRRVRVDATSPTPWVTDGPVAVVHLGQSALVLADRRGHLVVTSAAFGLAPGGMQLDAGEFTRLRAEAASGRTAFAHWRPHDVTPVDLRVRRVRVDPDAVELLSAATEIRRHADALDPRPQRSTAPSLVRAVLAGEPLAGTVRRLVGAGPGSTPAGDDVVVGVLAALLATGRPDAAAAISREAMRLLDRTTSASRMYLSAAGDGRFAERVHELVLGLQDASSAASAVRSARTWGATSGLDLLSGILAVATTSALSRRAA